MSLVIAESLETFVQPLNNNVIFLKESDITLTNDAWRTAVNIDIRTYQDIISTIRQDLLLVEQNKKEFTSVSEIRQIELLLKLLELKLHDKKEFTSVSEIRQIELLLKLLELKLHDFHQILPRLDVA